MTKARRQRRVSCRSQIRNSTCAFRHQCERPGRRKLRFRLRGEPFAFASADDGRPVRRLTFEHLAVALAFVGIAAAACLMPAQTDTWWHLRAGQEIWRTGRVPLHDSFSHTAFGEYWPNHEWLTQFVFFAIYRTGGMALLTAAAAGLATATWILVWHVTPGPAIRRLSLLGLTVPQACLAWSLRPQVFTLFLFALTVVLLRNRRDWALPFVFLVWANLHGAVTIGFVLLAAAALERFIEERALPRRLLAAILLCVAATTMTPLGLSFWTEIPASLARIQEYQIAEWRRPGLADWTFVQFWVMAAAFVTLVWVKKPWRQVERTQTVAIWLALAVLPLAVTAGRNVPPFMLLVMPAVATLLGTAEPAGRARARRERPMFNVAVLSAAAIVAIVGVSWSWNRQVTRLGWHPLPAEAIAAVTSCPGELYNRYDEGGSLVWFAPTKRVFLDGRQDPYPSSLIRDQMRLEESGDFEETFSRYGIGCAFMPSESILTQRLVHAGWHTSFHDSGWIVLSRN